MAKSAKRQFLCKVAGVSGLWMTKTGGEITSDTTKVYDGGSLQPDTLAGPAQASNVVVTRAYDHARDAAVVNTLCKHVGRYRTTLSMKPTNIDLVAIGTGRTYPNALLVGVTEPELDAASGDPAIVQLEFSVGGWQ